MKKIKFRGIIYTSDFTSKGSCVKKYRSNFLLSWDHIFLTGISLTVKRIASSPNVDLYLNSVMPLHVDKIKQISKKKSFKAYWKVFLFLLGAKYVFIHRMLFLWFGKSVYILSSWFKKSIHLLTVTLATCHCYHLCVSLFLEKTEEARGGGGKKRGWWGGGSTGVSRENIYNKDSILSCSFHSWSWWRNHYSQQGLPMKTRQLRSSFGIFERSCLYIRENIIKELSTFLCCSRSFFFVTLLF